MAAPKKVDVKAQFEAAAAAAKKTKKKPDNATLLKLYSYYKQATDGDVAGPRPGGFDFVGGAKHDAWSKLKGMSKDEAMQNYIKQVDKLNREYRRGERDDLTSAARRSRAFGARFAGLAALAALACGCRRACAARLAGFGRARRRPPDFTSLLTAAASSSTRAASRCTSFCV